MLGGKAGGVLKGLMGEYLKRESWLSGSLAEIAGLKWAVVQFHCMTYLERLLRWVPQSVEEREREEKVLNSLLFVCECVAAGEPSNCPASNISTKLIKLCQKRFIRECLLVFLFRENYDMSCFITIVQSCDEYI